MEEYRPGQECSVCKGKCCKSKGCSLSPEDMVRAMEKKGIVEINKDSLEAFLKDEDTLFAIDYFTDDKGMVYHLRMKHKCFNFVGVDAFGECIALTEDGCSLSFEDRPLGGKALKSSPSFQCRQSYDGAMMRRDWEPYSVWLGEIYRRYEAVFEADGTFDHCEEENQKRVMALRQASLNR